MTEDAFERAQELRRRGELIKEHCQKMVDESRKIARQQHRALPKQGNGDFQPNLIFITHDGGFTPVLMPTQRNAAVVRALVARRRSHDRAVNEFQVLRDEFERLLA